MKLDELIKKQPAVKVLLLGDSKSGKTGALASLAKAGYNLRIIDFDNGARILHNYLKNDPEAMARIEIEVCTDAMKVSVGRIHPREATAWAKMMNLLSDWKPFGPVDTWGTKDILIVDSLSFAGQAAMNFHMGLNNKLAIIPDWQDFKSPQHGVANLQALLYSDAIKCNVICITHVDYQAPPGLTKEEKAKQADYRGYPSSIGSAMGPKLSRWYNSTLLFRTDGGQRGIWTQSRDSIEIGNEAPSLVKPFYPISTGLADFFADVRGENEGKPKVVLAV